MSPLSSLSWCCGTGHRRHVVAVIFVTVPWPCRRHRPLCCRDPFQEEDEVVVTAALVVVMVEVVMAAVVVHACCGGGGGWWWWW